MYLPLLITAAFISFFSNWQFAFQITYVNTSSQTFYDIVNAVYSCAEFCGNCSLPYSQWSIQWSLIVTSFYPGTVVGLFLVPLIVSGFGVRQSLALACIPAITGCVLQLLSFIVACNGTITLIALLCIGRFLIGIHAGISLCLLPVFIIEISPLKYRGVLATFQQVSQSLSTVIGFIVGSENLLYLGSHRFQWLQVIAALPTVVFLLILILLPETPRHHFLRSGDILRSGKAATFYCGEFDTTNFCRELQDEIDGICYTKFTTEPVIMKGLLIGSIAALSFAFTADDVIDTFSAHVIHESSHSERSVNTDFKTDITTVFLGIVLFVSSIFGILLINRFGRRSLIIIGLIGTSISNSIAVLTAFVNCSSLVIITFSITKCFIGLGAGAPAWFLTSDLVPPNAAFICQSISTGILLTATGIISLLFLKLELIFGFWTILIIASGPALICALLLYLFLPETKNKSYYNIRYELAANTFSGIKRHVFRRYDHPSYGSTNNNDIILFY